MNEKRMGNDVKTFTPEFKGKKTSTTLSPTSEQRSIMEHKGSQVVNALAGSGKTSTLVMVAQSMPNKKILYLVYNVAMRDEAKSRMPKNVSVSTIHGYAYYQFRVRNHGRVPKIEDLRIKTIMENAQFKKDGIMMGNGMESFALSDLSIKYLSYYWNSRHFSLAGDECLAGFLETVTLEAAVFLMEEREIPGKKEKTSRAGDMVYLCSELWRMMISEQIPITHDGYVKQWQLSNPSFSHDCVFVDEAQDSTDVLLSVLESNSKVKKIIVGDPHQQIYAWRHARNILSRFEYDKNTLSMSFRFGPAVAAVATQIIRKMKGIPEFSLRGNPAMPTVMSYGGLDLSSPKTVLSRNNQDIFVYLVNSMPAVRSFGGKIHFLGGIGGYRFMNESVMADIVDLGKNGVRSKGQFSGFESLAKLKEYAKLTENTELLASLFLADTYSGEIIPLLRQIKSLVIDNPAEAVITISTAHKAKGKEFDRVEVMPNFLDYAALQGKIAKEQESLALDPQYSNFTEAVKTNEEINLLYVAVTRARKELALPGWVSDLPMMPAVQFPTFK